MQRYLVMVMRRPHFDPAMVQPHKDFVEGLRAGGRLEMTGPFSDKSGGAYLMLANDMDEAMAMAHEDPAHVSGGWHITVYEWQAR